MIKLNLTQNYRPTVAVVIAFYNGAKWIERALRSVDEQSVPPNEIILVDDGSLAEENYFLQSCKDKYDFILLKKENGGQGSARNAGVKCAKSDFISFLDQDDFYCPGHIENLLNALPKKDLKFGFVYGDVCIANEKGETFFRGITYKHGPHPKRSVIECIEKDMFILPSATLISREAFIELNGFDEQFRGYEDDDLFLRMFLAGFSSYFIENIVTVWCLNAKSTTYSIHMIQSRYLFLKKLLSIFKDDPQKMEFFCADYILPRFKVFFLSESINAALGKCVFRKKINKILKYYCECVCKNQYVMTKNKLQLYLLTFALTRLSTFWITILYGFATLPGISSFLGFLLKRNSSQMPISKALLRRKMMALHSLKF